MEVEALALFAPSQSGAEGSNRGSQLPRTQTRSAGGTQSDEAMDSAHGNAEGGAICAESSAARTHTTSAARRAEQTIRTCSSRVCTIVHRCASMPRRVRGVRCERRRPTRCWRHGHQNTSQTSSLWLSIVMKPICNVSWLGRVLCVRAGGVCGSQWCGRCSFRCDSIGTPFGRGGTIDHGASNELCAVCCRCWLLALLCLRVG